MTNSNPPDSASALSSGATLTCQINRVLAQAFAACGLPTHSAQAVPATRQEWGDLQCNEAMPLAKLLRRPPRELALAIAEQLRMQPHFESVAIAGAGFINLRLAPAFLARLAEDQLCADTVGIVQETPQEVLLDFGGPNVAKPLHVGHLRSLVIGESLRRILGAQGHRTIADVHLGDWGLQMGMLIAALCDADPTLPALKPAADGSGHGGQVPARTADALTMQDLQRLYPQAAAACKADPARMEAARQATAALQAGHAEYMALWRQLRSISLTAQQRDFDTLDVQFDLLLGESDVQPMLADMIGQLRAAGIALDSEGALVIDVADAADTQPMPPLLLAKSDGAALYATTDLATILQRASAGTLARIIYVVDQRQALHFEQVFRAARRAGYARGIELVHVGFGTVNGADNKPYKTRQGGVAQLADLLNDAIDKARDKLASSAASAGSPAVDPDGPECAPDAAPARLEALARQVGIAAVKFADLATHRTSGYVYDPERMVSFEGRTGPYVQYACVRIGSIIARATAAGIAPGPILVEAATERAVIVECARLPDVVASAAANLAPNEIADYVYTLAQTFSRFYAACPVVGAGREQTQSSRLTICMLARRVMTKALYLLGIAVPERM